TWSRRKTTARTTVRRRRPVRELASSDWRRARLAAQPNDARLGVPLGGRRIGSRVALLAGLHGSCCTKLHGSRSIAVREDAGADHFGEKVHEHPRFFLLAAAKIQGELVPVAPVGQRAVVAKRAVADEVEKAP